MALVPITVDRDCTQNLAGYKKLVLIPVEKILSMPVPTVLGALVGNITMAYGTNYFVVNLVPDVATLEEFQIDNVMGTTHRTDVQFFIPRDIAATWFFSDTIKRHRWVILAYDLNGRVRVIGDRTFPARGTVKLMSGAQSTSRAGHTVNFTAASKIKIPYWTGDLIEAAVGVYISPPSGILSYTTGALGAVSFSMTGFGHLSVTGSSAMAVLAGSLMYNS